jgi:membrane-associated phospholipid phosphatase
MSTVVAGVALLDPAFRNWIPAAYLLAMYWIPARLITFRHVRFEAWLVSTDERWRSTFAFITNRTLPALALEGLELAYFLCYPIIPIGIALLLLNGAAAHADRYWTAVLLAGALSYGALPWLATHPPRVGQGHAAEINPLPVRAFNLRVQHHGSVKWNTFPSGHVATAFAAALTVAIVLPVWGSVLLALALAISIAAVTGGYHYVADIFAGGLTAAIGFAVSSI